jgi:HPt (histidine-containing phosphotransfer) domain-containing protein
MSTAILDASTIESLLELESGSPGLLAELLEIYTSQTPPMIAELRKALQSGDRESARKVAHSLKGSSANLGAAAVVTVAASLEKDPGAADWEIRIARLESAYSAALVAFTSVVDDSKNQSATG